MGLSEELKELRDEIKAGNGLLAETLTENERLKEELHGTKSISIDAQLITENKRLNEELHRTKSISVDVELVAENERLKVLHDKYLKIAGSELAKMFDKLEKAKKYLRDEGCYCETNYKCARCKCLKGLE